MTLQDRLAEDLKTAAKSGDKERLSTIRMLRAALKNAEIAKMSALSDAEVLDILYKDSKQHRESIAEFTKGNRPEMAAKEEAELAIILEYMPKQASPEEIETLVRQVIDEVGAEGPNDKGKVMSKLMPQLKGKSDGNAVNEIVMRLLS